MYDMKKIMRLLPHRYPFLLIDRVLEVVPGERIVALKNVTVNEPFFPGHFPGNPIMPGVMIVEAMAQAGGVLAMEALNRTGEDSLIYFMGIDKVKFRKPVVPGDQLILEMEILKHKKNVMKFAGLAKVDENVVAQAELLASIGDKEDDS